jgi:hypothetical protein
METRTLNNMLNILHYALHELKDNKYLDQVDVQHLTDDLMKRLRR